MLITFVLVGLIALGIIWRIPIRQVSAIECDLEKSKLENEARRTIVQVIGGIVLLCGLYFTIHQIEIANAKAEAEKLNAAVLHLGSDNEALRVIGVSELRGIAERNPNHQRLVAETLYAFTTSQIELERERHTLQLFEVFDSVVEGYEEISGAERQELRYFAYDALWPSWSARTRPFSLPQELAEKYPIVVDRVTRYSHDRRQHFGRDIAAAVNALTDLSPTPPPYIHGLYLRNPSFEECNFSGWQLPSATLVDGSLSSIVIDETDLSHGQFVDCDFTGVDFRTSDLAGSVFIFCNLSAVLFDEENVDSIAEFRGVTVSEDDWKRMKELAPNRFIMEEVEGIITVSDRELPDADPDVQSETQHNESLQTD